MVNHLKELWGVYAICIAVLAVMILVVKYDAQEQKEWSEFAAANNCKAVEFREGSTLTGIGNTINGNTVGVTTVVTVIPDQTCWSCDDGKRYWRNN